MGEPLQVSVIILSYNTCALLRRCLAAAQTTLRRSAFSYEVIVVDNASSDGSPEMVAHDCPAVRLVCNAENRGYAAGNNVGIRASSGEFILLLNSDAFLDRDAVTGLVAHFQCHPETGIAGPLLAYADGTVHLSCRHFPTVCRHLVHATGVYRWWPSRSLREWDWMCNFAHDQPRRVDMLSGACWMLRRSMLDGIGLLNEELFLYGEEFDLCWRAQLAGWETWFVPVGPVVHEGGRSSVAPIQEGVVSNYHRYRSDYLTLRWHRGILQACIAVAADQMMLRSRLLKARLNGHGGTLKRSALSEAARNSRRAACEMLQWRAVVPSH